MHHGNPEPELPEEHVGWNRGILKYLNGNRALEMARRRERSFEEEVDDLFYFFGGFGRCLKGCINLPQLREYHDERLAEAGKVLNVLALATKNETVTAEKLRKEFLANLLSDGKNISYLRKIWAALKYCNSMNGSLYMDDLHEEPLKKYLKSRRKRIIPEAVASTGLAAYFTSYMLGDGNATGAYFGIWLMGLSAVGNTKAVLQSPHSYWKLRRKAYRMDRFMEMYM